MKKLLIGLAVLAVALAVILGVQVADKNRLQDEANTHKTMLGETQTELSALTESRDSAQAALKEAEETNKAITTEMEGLKASLVDAQGQAAALTEEKDKLSGDLAAAETRAKDAGAQVESLNAELEGLKVGMGEAQAQVAALTGEKDKLTDALAAAENKAKEDATKIQELESQVTTLTANAGDSKAALDDLTERHSELGAQLEEAQTAAEALKTSLGEAQAQVKVLTEEKAELSDDLAAAKAAREESQAKIGEQEREIASLTTKGDELTAQIATLNAEAETMKGSLGEAQAQVASLTEEKEKLTGELAAAEATAKESSAKLEEQAGEIATRSSQNSELTAQLEILQAEAETLKRSVDIAHAQVASLTEENEKLTSDLAAAGESGAKLEEHLTAGGDELAAQVEMLKAEAEMMKGSLDMAHAQVAGLTEEKEKLKGDLAAAEATAKESSAKLEEQAGEIAALTSQNSELTAQLEEAQVEAESLKTSLGEAQAQIAALMEAGTEEPVDMVGEAVAAVEEKADEAMETAGEAATAVEEKAEAVTINLYHTNDVHSRVEGNDKDQIGYAKVAAIVKEARANGPTLLVDVGDALHGMSIATVVEGESIVKLMNLLQYDAMAPGNHDFNYGYERLKALEKEMSFPLLNSNILLADGQPAFKPYAIVEAGGKRIALVGAANPQIQSAIHPKRIEGLQFQGLEAVEKAVQDALAEKPDAVIILAHWGSDDAYDPNSSVLAKIPGVNLVIDGHSHTAYEDIKQVEGGAVIVSARQYLENLGHVALQFNENNELSIDVSPISFENTADVQPDEEVVKAIEEIKSGMSEMLNEVVGKTKVLLDGERANVRTMETNLGDLAADALRESTGANFAFTNGGGIRTSVPEGDITRGKLIEVFPFGNSVVLIEITGEKLLAAMEHGLRLYPEQNGGFPQISGGKLVFDPSAEPGQRVKSLMVGEEEVDPAKTYTLATNDFTAAGGDDYAMLKDCPVLVYGGTLDEALIAHIQSLGEVDQQVEGRLTTVEAEAAPAEEEKDAAGEAAAMEEKAEEPKDAMGVVAGIAEEKADEAKDMTGEVAAAVEEKADEAKDMAGEVVAAVEGKVDEAKDMAGEVVTAVEGKVEEAKDMVGEAVATVEEKADEAKDMAGEVAAAVEEKADEAKDMAGEVVAAVEGKVDEAKDMAGEVVAAVEGKVEEAKDMAGEAAAAVEEKVDEAKDMVGEAVAAGEEKAEEMTAGGEKQKVSVWYTFTKAQEAYLVKAADDFNASQDKIEVEMLSQPGAGFTDNVYGAVNEGVGPDIIFNYASEAVKYIPSGKVADLSQYIYDGEIGIEGFDEALDPVILEGEVKGFSDGLIHYVPAYTSGPIYFYNKTLFDELGLKVPTTWEELAEVNAAIYEKKGIPGLGTDSLTDMVQQLIMESEESGYIDVENKAVLFDTPQVREKLGWLVDQAKKGHFAVKPTGNYASEDFNGGTIGAFIGSVAGYPYVNLGEKGEFAVAPMPTKNWYPSWNRGPIVFDYGDDARTEAAYEFVKYFISADVNAGWAEAVVALAPYSWTKDTEAYKAFISKDDGAIQALNAVNENLDKVGPLPNVTGAAQIRRYIEDAVVKAAGGEMTLEAAWDEAVKLSNEALKGN